MRTRTFLPLLLGLSCLPLALGGCGNAKLLDGRSADELSASVANVQQAVDAGRCDEARAAADEGLVRVGQLPSSVDAALVDNLRTGFQRLQATVAADCQATTPTTDTVPPAVTEPEPEPTTTDDAPPTNTEPETTTDETPPPSTDTTPGTETDPGPGDGTGTGDGSGGTAPGVDGPQGAPRSREGGIRKTGRVIGDRVRQAVEDALDRVRGGNR